jgi:D-alanine-D-alanine ligase
MTIQVNVVMGGPSVEHEISLRSGLEVLRHLDTSKYAARAVVVSPKKEFFFHDYTNNGLDAGDLGDPAASGKFTGPFPAASCGKYWETCDVAFLALHGEFGENGVVQGFLETLDVPYTGSGVYASAVAMEKITSKYLYLNNGLPVPPYSIYGKTHPETTLDSIALKHGFPCFVKCPQSGSSRLLGRADSPESLAALIAELEPHADNLLVETSIKGIEFSCGVLEKAGRELLALPPIEIRTVHSDYFDYTAKYSSGASEEIVPAPRPPELLERIKSAALAAHRILGCKGVSRTDMIYAGDLLYVLETNTLPGLTPQSLLPKAFSAIGGTYTGLLDILISTALDNK